MAQKKGKNFKSENSREIVGWYTRGGKHIPITKGKKLAGDSYHEGNARKVREEKKEYKQVSQLENRETRYERFLQKYRATDYDIDEALDYMYGTDRKKKDFMDYTDREIADALDYMWHKDKLPKYKSKKGTPMYFAQLPTAEQEKIKRKLKAKGIKGEDLNRAMNSKLTDLDDIL